MLEEPDFTMHAEADTNDQPYGICNFSKDVWRRQQSGRGGLTEAVEAGYSRAFRFDSPLQGRHGLHGRPKLGLGPGDVQPPLWNP